MFGRTACAALAALLSSLVGCLLTTSLDDLEGGAGGMSAASTSAVTTTTGGAAGSTTSSGGSSTMPTVLVDGEEGPDAIAVDGEDVYFSTKDGFIKRVPIDGGTAGIVASGHYAVPAIALSDQLMWWSVYNAPPVGAIWRAEKSGANAQVLVSDQNLPTEVVYTGAHIYWSTTGAGGQIRRADPLTGAGVEVAEDSEAFFFSIDGDWLFFTMNYTAPGPTGQVWGVQLSPPYTRVDIAQGLFKPAAIAANSTQVVWAQEGDGLIASASPPAYSVSTVSTGGTAPRDVALDGGNIYWTDPGGGRVMKVMNGDETVLAAGDGTPRNIAVDATSVYWTDNANGMVLKAPK
ncbi:MAG TPA: hypothetical protein VFB62_12490 [Polyangiaceae bacterium]|jgi:hypothetical protein|nr:hypothetical protein [Polyangiaceae bacterium]